MLVLFVDSLELFDVLVMGFIDFALGWSLASL
jgi:hypothetical protein